MGIWVSVILHKIEIYCNDYLNSSMDDNFAKDLFSDAIQRAQNIKNLSPSLDKSITFLNRSDVQQQVDDLLTECSPCEVFPFWKRKLGVVYLILLIKQDEKLKACVNLWPENVGYKFFDTPVDCDSKEYEDCLCIFG
jgi:hypothetical protein